MQEALTNVAKHARATRVKLRLVRQPDSLRITLTDNGRGLQPTPENGHGFGILGMIERAATLGGELTVQPAKRQGTQVSLRIPLAVAVPDPAE